MRKFLLILCLSLGPYSAAWSQESEIRDVISQQLQAFQKDDFAKAFTFASPVIKGIFGTSQRFGEMVKQGYPMVWRPADVKYGSLVDKDGLMEQTVFFTDHLGRVFQATYHMVETVDGWQINGVHIKEAGIGA